MKNKIGLILTGVVVSIITLAIIGGTSSSFTIYPVQCNDWLSTPPTIADFSNCHQAKALERHTFTVDTTKNEVTQTSPENADVKKLNYCTIQDSQHWSCGDGSFSKMPGGILAATQISRSGDRYAEYGLTGVIFVTEDQWSSINNGKSSICGSKWCD